jgi:ribosomal protein S18 acetylase RimI-like enzyme
MTLAENCARTATPVVVVRPLRHRDHSFAAALHESALPHGFFGRLGTGFLRAYHESFMASPHAVAYVAENRDGRVGYLVGTFGPHNAWVLRNRWMKLVSRGALALLARPSELAFFLRTRTGSYLQRLVRVVARRPAEARPHRTTPPAVLTHVAVAPAARGLGVGEALVDAFLQAARKSGATEACLVTLAGPDGAGPFYRRLGWNLTELRDDRDGRPIEHYCRRL